MEKDKKAMVSVSSQLATLFLWEEKEVFLDVPSQGDCLKHHSDSPVITFGLGTKNETSKQNELHFVQQFS